MNKINSPANNLIVLVDALRHDYVTQEGTPFLWKLKSENLSAEVVETFAFQTRPAYFAGLDPDQSNICHLFKYEPESSPFAFLRLLAPVLRAFAIGGEIKLCRGIIKRLARMRERNLGFHASADVLSTERIPLWMLHYFAPSEREYTDRAMVFGENPTLFDNIQQLNKSWAWIGYPRHYGSTTSILKEYRNLTPPVDYAYLHFSELDWIGHKFGPDSQERINALCETDSVLETIASPILESGGSVAVFGDHGMVEVKQQIDLWSKLLTLPCKLGDDYLVFIDSTQARFWFFNSEAQTAVESLCEKIPQGHLLTGQERNELGLNFQERAYGDALFALDVPGILHPSFFSWEGQGPKGMHGYLPHIRDNNTQLIIANQKQTQTDLGLIKMTEIYPLLRSILQ